MTDTSITQINEFKLEVPRMSINRDTKMMHRSDLFTERAPKRVFEHEIYRGGAKEGIEEVRTGQIGPFIRSNPQGRCLRS